MGNTYTPVTRAEYSAHRGQARPGMVALYNTIIFCMGGAMAGMGIVSDRRQRGGLSLSLHSVGRAGDEGPRVVMVGARAGRSARQNGDELFVRLIAAAPAIGLDEVIWYGKRWTPEKGVRNYYGVNRHKDHVHIGLDPAMADNAAPYDDLCRWFASAIFHV